MQFVGDVSFYSFACQATLLVRLLGYEKNREFRFIKSPRKIYSLLSATSRAFAWEAEKVTF